MAFVDLSSLAQFSPEKLRKVAFFESSRLLCDVYCLLPGQQQKTHVHDDMDKLYVVLSGRATAVLGDEERELGPGQAAVAPAGTPHGLRNPTDAPATVLVVQGREKPL